jgi:hypothetical protein
MQIGQVRQKRNPIPGSCRAGQVRASCCCCCGAGLGNSIEGLTRVLEGFYVLDPTTPKQLILGPFMGKVCAEYNFLYIIFAADIVIQSPSLYPGMGF